MEESTLQWQVNGSSEKSVYKVTSGWGIQQLCHDPRAVTGWSLKVGESEVKVICGGGHVTVCFTCGLGLSSSFVSICTDQKVIHCSIVCKCKILETT